MYGIICCMRISNAIIKNNTIPPMLMFMEALADIYFHFRLQKVLELQLFEHHTEHRQGILYFQLYQLGSSVSTGLVAVLQE